MSSRCEIEGEVLVVNDGGLSDRIVFACKGSMLAKTTTGAARRPKAPDLAAAKPPPSRRWIRWPWLPGH